MDDSSAMQDLTVEGKLGKIGERFFITMDETVFYVEQTSKNYFIILLCGGPELLEQVSEI